MSLHMVVYNFLPTLYMSLYVIAVSYIVRLFILTTIITTYVDYQVVCAWLPRQQHALLVADSVACSSIPAMKRRQLTWYPSVSDIDQMNYG